MTPADVRALILKADRPLLWLGHGIRLAEAVGLIDPLLDHLGVPALVSWAGLDMSDHPLIYGRAGIYGQRAANHIVQRADLIVAIGTRLAIPQVGYDIGTFAPGARLVVVDIDEAEATKYERFEPVVMDAGDFMRELLEGFDFATNLTHGWVKPGRVRWKLWCDEQRRDNPWVGPEHDATPGYINSYRFMERLNQHLKPDQVIVTDSGTALVCAHQVLRLRPPQRLITTTGLGEMGFGLPAAIGASFARNKGEVLCLNTDGGMMLNLQELQTIAHHRLPIKIVVFCNDGYGMIRATQQTFGGVRVGVDRESGVSCPEYTTLAQSLGIRAGNGFNELDGTYNADMSIQWLLMDEPGPALLTVDMDPAQPLVPKVATIKREDGTLYSPSLDEMSPVMVRSG